MEEKNKYGNHPEFKPCPFCGNDITLWYNWSSGCFDVLCTFCGTHCQQSSSTVAIAAEKWNRRVSE